MNDIRELLSQKSYQTLACRPAFLTTAAENKIRLQRSKELRNKEEIRYIEKIGDH